MRGLWNYDVAQPGYAGSGRHQEIRPPSDLNDGSGQCIDLVRGGVYVGPEERRSEFEPMLRPHPHATPECCGEPMKPMLRHRGEPQRWTCGWCKSIRKGVPSLGQQPTSGQSGCCPGCEREGA